jgi:hypothetical protein
VTGGKDAAKLAREKRELWRRLNKPRIVSPFPAADLCQRMEEAVTAWWRDIFEYFGVEPNGPHSWELIACRLAGSLFPGFDIVGKSKVGAPVTAEKVDSLLNLFEAFRPPKGGRGLKAFLEVHKADCDACGIKNYGSLKDAFYRARKRQRGTQLLIQFEMERALGIRENMVSLIGPINQRTDKRL